MTKEKLRRLIELTYSLGFEHARWGSEAEDKGELFELQAEFEAWEPEAERDEARQVAISLLVCADALDYTLEWGMTLTELEQKYPWLEEKTEGGSPDEAAALKEGFSQAKQ